MNILVSNDDGYQSDGIKLLEQHLSKIAQVVVVAPIDNKSACSSALTVNKSIKISKIAKNIYAVNGNPGDCVHLALYGLLKDKFDIVVSGINFGSNLGDDVIYSGTVAAAIEGRFLGLPSLAISLTGHQGKHFDTAAIVASQLVTHIKTAKVTPNTILNVNVPDIPYKDIKGCLDYRITERLCQRAHTPRDELWLQAGVQNRNVYIRIFSLANC